MASSSETNDNNKLFPIWLENVNKGKQAIQEGRVDDLAAIIESTHSLNYEPPSNNSSDDWLAFHAVECRSTTSLDVIFRHGWNIDTPESYFLPPLLGKVIRDGYKSGNLDMDLVHWFLNHKANPNAYASQHAITPLSNAVRYGTLDLVKLLFEYGGSALEGDLIYYLITYDEGRKDYPEFLQKFDFLVQRGAPVNQALFERFPHLKDVTMFSYTPLVTACGLGDARLVKLLLDAGADPRKPSPFDYTPLQAAEKIGDDEIKKMLLDAIALLPRL